MRNKMKKHIRTPMYILIACSMILAAGLSCVEAAPITYVFSGVGFGVFNNAEFNDAAFSIRLSGDTSGVVEDSGQFLNSGLSGTISGFGPDIDLPVTAFANPLAIYLDPVTFIVGIFDPAAGFANDLLDYFSDDFENYDLKSEFFTEPASFLFASDITLADGSVLGFEQIDSASFAANVVPEPASIALLASGLFGLALLKLRKKPGASAAD
jgi:hypothetical protein